MWDFVWLKFGYVFFCSICIWIIFKVLFDVFGGGCLLVYGFENKK